MVSACGQRIRDGLDVRLHEQHRYDDDVTLRNSAVTIGQRLRITVPFRGRKTGKMNAWKIMYKAFLSARNSTIYMVIERDEYDVYRRRVVSC